MREVRCGRCAGPAQRNTVVLGHPRMPCVPTSRMQAETQACTPAVSVQEAAALVVAKQEAVSRFWELLHDFLAVSAAPAQWCDALPPAHPFFRVVEGVLCVHQPGGDPMAV
jgi:hypothetical protein